MDADAMWVAYVVCGLFLVVGVGTQLTRYGAVFLREVYGAEAVATSVNRLLTLGYYLVGAGFVLCTSAVANDWYSGPASQLRILVVKIGFLGVVLGLLHFLNLRVLTGDRRRRRIPA